MGAVIILCVVALPLFGQSSGIQYFYDDIGRLIKAVDQNGNVATYAYDAVGNLLSITRSTLPANNGLAVLNFTPQSGPVGQSVTIQGQGFSTTASSNTVQFNGVAAAVTVATANSLTVTVPSAATTGLITVMVSGQSTNSGTAFTVTNGVLQSIAVSPANTSVHSGAQPLQFTATGTFANGSQQNLTASVAWSSSNPAVATISNAPGSQGLVTIGVAGSTTIVALSGAVGGTATLQVLSPTNLVVEPASTSIFAGNSQQFSAIATFSDGTTSNVTASATWTSSNTFLATVSNSSGSQGVATGVNQGSVAICATLQLESCSNVTVEPAVTSVTISPTNVTIPIGAQQFIATGPTGQNITSLVTWSSSNPAVATISNTSGSQGLATGLSVGTTTITATAGTVSASSTLTMTAAVPTVTVSPGRDVIQAGNSFQLKATLQNPDGSKQDVTQTATWESSAPTVATINQGMLAALQGGTVTITATSGSATGSSSVIVTTSTQGMTPRYMFEAATGSTEGGIIAVYAVNASTGQLRPEGIVLQDGTSSDIAVDPASQYVYVANTSSTTAPNTLSVYTVGANGSLTESSAPPVATGNFPNAVATDPLGRFVYIVNGNDETVSGFSIGPSGALTPVSGSPFGVGLGPLAAVVDPSGQFVYVLNATEGTVSAFTIDPNSGSLTPVAGSPFATGVNPQLLAVDPSGKFVLVANSGGGGSTSEATPPADHPTRGPGQLMQLAALETFPLAEFGSMGAALRYVSNPIEGFGSSSETTLLPAENSPALPAQTARSGSAAGRRFNPQGCGGADTSHRGGAMPQGCGSSGNASISVFSINTTSGALAPVTNSPFAVSATADSIAIDPTDRFVYLTYESSVVDGFAFDATSGSLSELPDAPYSGSQSFLTFVAVDPSGEFVYASGGIGSFGSNLLTFNINSSTGSLTQIGSVPNAPGFSDLVISRGGTGVTYTPQFAYVFAGGGTNGSNNISGYSINPVSGALTPLSNSPFAEGLSPTGAAVDPWNPLLYVANNCSDSACAESAGSVSAYVIDPNSGTLTPALGSPYLAGASPLGLAVDPSGGFVYLVDNADVTLWGYSINLPAGSLSPLTGSPVYGKENGLAGVAFDPVGEHTYVSASFDYYYDKCTQNCVDGHLYSYNYPLFASNTAGQIAFVDQTITIGPSPTSLAMDPTGWFALITDTTTNSVYVISTATESQVTGSPFATGVNPMSVAVDPTGRFVYVANQGSNNMSAYTIDPSLGTLIPIPGSPFSVGNAPISVTVDLSGNFLYVVNQQDNTVSAFSINQTAGVLTPVAGSPFATGTSPVSIITEGKVQ